ncbi:DgyrCDS10166 [Dimorphilus gyrociliatus]|uniref:DgyrCDS10166 n=1 Tax=Dimorphilus gyrociliatus TaxID=2664684 RepID=A0A7I8VZB4_9ANNE|nr:DgyrCDS10166 [Dimorphilus gyrociliatus]
MENVKSDEEEEKSVSYDNIFNKAGDFGLYQILILTAIASFAVFASANNFSSSLTLADVPHVCKYPKNISHSIHELSSHDEKLLIIPKNSKGKFENCAIFDRPYSTMTSDEAHLLLSNKTLLENETASTIPCPNGYNYDTSEASETAVTEWNLVCGKKWQTDLASVVYQAGGFFGLLVIGFLGDLIGRRRTSLIALVFLIVVTILSGVARNYLFYLITRFVTGMFNLPVASILLILCLEITGPNWRIVVVVASHIVWVLGYFFLTLLAYKLNNWKVIHIVTGSVLILFLSFYFFIPESPRWLFSKRKIKECLEVLNKMAKANDRKFLKSANSEELKILDPQQQLLSTSDNFESEASTGQWQQQQEEQHIKTGTVEVKTYTPIDLFRFPVLRKRVIILCFQWFAVSFIYYSFVYGSSKFHGNIFINFMIEGAAEMPGVILSLVMMGLLGRNNVLSILFISCGVSIIISKFVAKWPKLIFILISKMMISGCFTTTYLYTNELLPTVLRCTGFCFISAVGRIAAIIVPFVGKIGGYASPVTSWTSAIIAGVMMPWLPETKGHYLPQKVSDIDRIPEDDDKEENITNTP